MPALLAMFYRIDIHRFLKMRTFGHLKQRNYTSSAGLLKGVGFSTALALNLASAYVEVRDANRRLRRTHYRLG